MENGTYNILKKVTQLWLPATGSLYFGLSQIWGLPSPEEVVGSITLLVTFFGVILGVSSKAYYNSDRPYDGSMVLKDGEGEGAVMSLEVGDNLTKIPEMNSVTLKVEDRTENATFWAKPRHLAE